MVATAAWSMIEQLPAEIILDVFSRLPAESVIRCMRVCRSWCSLLHLNSHHFSKLHLHQQQQMTGAGKSSQFGDFIIQFNPDESHAEGRESFEFLQFLDHDDDNGKDQAIVDDVAKNSKLFGNYYQVRKVNHRPMIDYDSYAKYISRMSITHIVGIIGSCNGLVCLGCLGDPTYICNPVTSEYVQIPRHEEYYDHNNHWFLCRMLSGFGYHPGTDEYKVVRIYYPDSQNKACEGQVQVYTLGKDHGRWRNKEPISHQLDRCCARGVLVNGTLYWMSLTYRDPFEYAIVAFDLAREEFYQVAKVPQAYCYDGPSRIYELGGCLSIIHLVAKDSTDVWMMKNKNSCTTRNSNDVEEEYSWVKEFTIPQNWNYCDIFALTKNGEILAWYSDGDELSEMLHGKRKNLSEVFLVSYNPKTGKFKRYADESNATRTTIKYWNGTIPHIKSFMSLKDLGEEDAKRVDRVPGVNMSLKRKASSCLNFNAESKKVKKKNEAEKISCRRKVAGKKKK